MIKYVPKLWGSEEWLVNTDKYCAKRLNLIQGYQCSLHMHKKKDETFYILGGTVELDIKINDYTFVIKLREGKQIRIKPGVYHRFRSLTPKSVILEVSTPHSDSDSYRLEVSRKI